MKNRFNLSFFIEKHITVIIVGNEHAEQSSNPEQGSLHFI